MSLKPSSLISHVRKIVSDRDTSVWTDAEILEAAHSVWGRIWEKIRCGGKDHHLDNIVVPRSEFVQVRSGMFEARLPEIVGSVRALEPASQVSFQLDVNARSLLPAWSFTEGAFPGKISFWQSLTDDVRVWFIRRYPPLHIGVAGSTDANGETLRFDQSATRVGELWRRPDLYETMQVEIVGDATTPSNVGLRSFISAWDGTDATLETPVGQITSGDTTYEVLAPMPDEAMNYFEWSVAEEMLGRSWDTGALASAQMMLYGPTGLERRFDAGLTRRISRERVTMQRNTTWRGR